VIAGYLVDNSAWTRLESDALPDERRRELAAEGAPLWTSSILRLEAGYSARDASDYLELMNDFDAFPEAVVDEAVHARACDLQAQLVHSGHHCVPPADLLTIAAAEANGLTVLHYDKDFDVIRERTDCVAATEWLAPRGSL
jgi:predicted nucleic acid-binding protein